MTYHTPGASKTTNMAGSPSQVGKPETVSVFLYLRHLKLIWNPRSSSYCEHGMI